MTFDVTVVIVAFITIVGGGGVVGWAAWRKSGPEGREADARATAAMVGAAGDTVTLLREELERMAVHQAETDDRLSHVEGTVLAWDGWGDRVLDILDKAFGLLTDEQRAAMLADVTHVRETRPPRYRHLRHREGANDTVST